MENNSIINDLKRLERIGSETSKFTEKLKISVKNVAKKIKDIIMPFCKGDKFEYITKKLCIIENKICFDMDEKLNINNFESYMLNPEEKCVNRKIALNFASAVEKGLLKKVINWIQRRKDEIEFAQRKINEVNI